MKKLISICFLLISGIVSNAQNLITNSNFEVSDCPQGILGASSQFSGFVIGW
jgi:hypothetical protein